MIKLVGLIFMLTLTGCTILKVNKEIACEVECTDCKKLVHKCEYIKERDLSKPIIEVN